MTNLLPPNASRHERNIAAANAAIGDIDVPLRSLMDPHTIRLDLLPWLAWHLGVDTWKDYWPESVKRDHVRQAIPIARRKGTAAAVRDVVATFGANLVLREWFEMAPRGTPGTFDIVMTVTGRNGEPATAEYVADIIAEIERTKPVRAHYTFTQGYSMQGHVGVAAAAQPALYRRLSLTDI